MHLILDGFDANRDIISNLEIIRGFLEKYPKAIGMTPISPPRVVEYHGKRPDDWGVSGFILIAESHISIHTFPEKRYLNVDIFSCKNFDDSLATSEVVSTFKIKKIDSKVLERGIEYLSVDHAVHTVISEREELI